MSSFVGHRINRASLMVICLVGNLGASCAEGVRLAPADQGFALYALSRGKGVPAAARDAMIKAREWLDDAKRTGRVVHIVETRIGLEGETRLCAEFADLESSQTMLERIRELVEGVELINLVVEPCRDDG